LLNDAFGEEFLSITIIPTTETETEILIQPLKSINPSGFDEISKILEAHSPLISFPVSHICNHSLHTGISLTS
jgi:hypothetical protein